MTTKIDLEREHPELYRGGAKPARIHVGPGWFLRLDGQGDPDGPAFQAAVEALYTLAFGLKSLHKGRGADFKVAKLEGLWTGADGGEFLPDRPDTWAWILQIRVPDAVGRDDLDRARIAAVQKGRGGAPVERVALQRVEEGPCVQILHVGPYDAEGPTLERLEAFAAAEGLTLVGPHHEVYLADPRRTAPERLRTLLRYPVAGA